MSRENSFTPNTRQMTRSELFLKSILAAIFRKSALLVLFIACITLLSSCMVMLDPPGGERHRFRNERGDRHERGDRNEHHDNDEHRN